VDVSLERSSSRLCRQDAKGNAQEAEQRELY
jgi:hypothetical protein